MNCCMENWSHMLRWTCSAIFLALAWTKIETDSQEPKPNEKRLNWILVFVPFYILNAACAIEIIYSIVAESIEIARTPAERGIGESGMFLMKLMVKPKPTKETQLPLTSRRLLSIRDKAAELAMVTLTVAFII